MRKLRTQLVRTYPLAARVWLVSFDPEEMYDYLEDEVAPEDLKAACRIANEWLYQRSHSNWDHGCKHPVEKAMERDEPKRFKMRRLAFARHVLATLAHKYPDLIQNLTEG